MFGIEKRRKAKEEALKKAQYEKEFRARALVNRTLRELKRSEEKYKEQQKLFLSYARDAAKNGLEAQYNMAKNGLKVVLESQRKVSAMYLNLTISNEIKKMTTNTRDFVGTMSAISKDLSEVTASMDFGELQMEYDMAMLQISQMDERVKDFTDNMYSSVEDYNARSEDPKIDSVIDDMIQKGYRMEETNTDVDKKLKALEDMIHDN